MEKRTLHKVVAGALVMGVLTGGATLAWAEPSYQPGKSESTDVQACRSDLTVTGTLASAQFYADPKDLPHAGDVFYGQVAISASGFSCQGGTFALPTVVPPLGVRLARSKEFPVLCAYQRDDEPRARQLSRSCAEVVTLPDGTFTIAAAAVENKAENGSFPIAGSNTLFLAFPLRSERRLVGNGSRAPSCRLARSGAPACSRETSGDHLQVQVSVADGGDQPFVAPFVGLFNVGPRKPRVKAPKSVRAVTLRRGLRVRVGTVPRARVTARVLSGGRVVARPGARADVDGAARLRVKVPQASRGKLRIEVRAKTVDGARSLPRIVTLRLR